MAIGRETGFIAKILSARLKFKQNCCYEIGLNFNRRLLDIIIACKPSQPFPWPKSHENALSKLKKERERAILSLELRPIRLSILILNGNSVLTVAILNKTPT
jgi:hypothetical protein